MAQMPEEGRKFGIVDTYWKDIMTEAVKDTDCLVATSQPRMLERLTEANLLLDEIQKGLNAYLEKKRLYFPRSDSFNLPIQIDSSSTGQTDSTSPGQTHSTCQFRSTLVPQVRLTLLPQVRLIQLANSDRL